MKAPPIPIARAPAPTGFGEEEIVPYCPAPGGKPWATATSHHDMNKDKNAKKYQTRIIEVIRCLDIFYIKVITIRKYLKFKITGTIEPSN
jgi:hypothetical protein